MVSDPFLFSKKIRRRLPTIPSYFQFFKMTRGCFHRDGNLYHLDSCFIRQKILDMAIVSPDLRLVSSGSVKFSVILFSFPPTFLHEVRCANNNPDLDVEWCHLPAFVRLFWLAHQSLSELFRCLIFQVWKTLPTFSPLPASVPWPIINRLNCQSQLSMINEVINYPWLWYHKFLIFFSHCFASLVTRRRN